MTGFVQTQLTLLAKLARSQSGMDEEAWSRFFELYYPAMMKFAEMFCNAHNAEDIVQRVLVKLVSVLREGRYQRQDGVQFRSYLKTLIRREFIDWRRTEGVRQKRQVPLDEAAQIAVDDRVALRLDLEWRLACHSAALEHVLTQMAMNRKMRLAYRLYVLEERPAAEVAATLGVSVGYVRLAKSRVNRLVTAVESIYGE